MIIRAFFLLLLTMQSLSAGLEQYRQFVVADGVRKISSNGIRITYLGTNGYEFKIGGHVLLVDPYFSRISMSQMLFAPTIHSNAREIESAADFLNAEVIVATHGHVDHLLDVPNIMAMTGARLIASRTSVEVACAAGASSRKCYAVHAGDLRRIGPWKIHVLAATHDRVFPIGVPFPGNRKRDRPPQRASDWVCGEPLAFLIEANGKRIYIDSGGRPSLLPPANIAPVDLAILGVALPDSRARFIEAVHRLHARFILPSHQDNFFQPLDRGFVFAPLTDFPRVVRDYKNSQTSAQLILLDYFRPWTLR